MTKELNIIKNIECNNDLKNLIMKIFEYSEIDFMHNPITTCDDTYFRLTCDFKLTFEELQIVLDFKEWLNNDENKHN